MDQPTTPNDTPNTVPVFWADDAKASTTSQHPCAQACQLDPANPCVGQCKQEQPRGDGWGAASSTPDLTPLSEVPFIMRPGRYDPHDPARIDPLESPESRAMRIGILTRHWAAEDAAMATVDTVQHAEEDPEQRRLRLNREAQTRWREKNTAAKAGEHTVVRDARLKLAQARAEALQNRRLAQAHTKAEVARLRAHEATLDAQWAAYVQACEQELASAMASHSTPAP